MRQVTERTEQSTRLTTRTEIDLLLLSAFTTLALLCLSERFVQVPGAVAAYLAAALVVTRGSRGHR